MNDVAFRSYVLRCTLKAFGSIILFTCFSSALYAQSIELDAPVIHVTTRLVLLDSSVVDAKGNPVQGLTKDDFDVFEDEHSKEIVSFDTSQQLLLPEPARKKNITLDVLQPKQFGRAPVTIFVLDEVNTHFADSSFAVRSLRSYLQKQPELLPHAAALFSVTDAGFQLLQSYTADRDMLLRALNSHKVMYAWKLEQFKSVGDGVVDRLGTSLSALEQIAQNSAAIPVHKSLIWMGAGFPSVDPAALSPATEKLLKNTLQHVTDELLDARVSVYAVDPTSTAAGMTEITDESQLAFIAVAGDTTSGLTDPFDKSFDFDRLSPVSGGRVIRGLNNIDQQIDLSERVGSSYYTLGYQPTETAQDENPYRKIRIVCKRRGTTVLSRDGYYASQPSAVISSRDTVQSDLNNAAIAKVPFSALGIQVTGSLGKYVVHVQSSGLNWKTDNDGEQNAHVQVMAVALSAKGLVLGHHLQSMTANSPATLNAADGHHDVAFGIEFTAPPKTKMVRFVVRDSATGHMGTADLPSSQK